MRSLVFVASLVFSASAAVAQVPDAVLAPYKAFNKALQDRDFDTAKTKIKESWEQAEALMGDHKTTGDLAQNYGDVCIKIKCKHSDIKKAYLRAIELSDQYPEDAAKMRLQREVNYGHYLVVSGRPDTFNSRFKKAVLFADENGESNSVFMGELYTIRAQTAVRSRNHKTTSEYADKALSVFESPDDSYASVYPLLARLYSGYGKEGAKDFVPALMDYQEIMENTDGKLPRSHPFRMRALGRWMTMRNRIKREGLSEEAEAAGMCECWPYDKARNETVKAVKRVPPKMPRKAWQSGFVIMEFDLEDDGSVKDPRILEAWPEEVWDKSAMRAMKQWKYTPRTPDETDEDRKDIVSTLRYMLADERGNLIE